MFYSHLFEVQCNIMNFIEQSIAAIVARGNHLSHWKILRIIRKLPRNIYLTFNFCSSHHDGAIHSILYMILSILQGCMLGSTLKINMMRVLYRSFAPMRIQFMFKLVGMPCLHSLP